MIYKCKECGCIDFIHRTGTLYGVQLRTGANKEELQGTEQWEDVESETYCISCKADVDLPINVLSF